MLPATGRLFAITITLSTPLARAYSKTLLLLTCHFPLFIDRFSSAITSTLFLFRHTQEPRQFSYLRSSPPDERCSMLRTLQPAASAQGGSCIIALARFASMALLTRHILSKPCASGIVQAQVSLINAALPS